MRSALPLNDPWLSVAMPVHCGDRWLPATLASAAVQDCTGIEFILIDSGAEPSCQRIAAEYSDKLNIRYEHRTELTSWMAKTNLAVQQSRAPHVAMLHQDDLWMPSRVEDMRAAINFDPDAVLLLNPSHIVDTDGRSLGLWRCPLPPGSPLRAPELAERLLVQNFVAIPAPIVRRDAWLAAGGMDEELWYTADWDLYLKLARQGSAVYRECPTTGFRIHRHSLTVSGSRDRKAFESQMMTVVDRHLDLVPPGVRATTRRRATTSIAVNCELAKAASGHTGALVKAVARVCLLGPRQSLRYLADSRIVERALPRLRARLAGNF